MTLTVPTCTACGHALVENARYCPGCGRRVGTLSQAHSHYMTVLICDLAGSTAMTDAMGDEAMFNLITRFQRICTDAVAENGGLVAKFMGDGMLAYFGHPEPVKNSAESAVTAARHILDGMGGLSDGLSANAGVATGWMVVGDMYDLGPASETLAVGGTVNLAARLQSEAGIGEIAVSEETRRRLDPTRFKLTPRGRRLLRGLQEPVELWTATPTEARGGETILVARETALAALDAAWSDAGRGGGPRVCEIVAPAGYGKTALVRHFIGGTVNEADTLELRAERHLTMQSFSCFRSFLRTVVGLAPGSSVADQRSRLVELVPEATRAGLLDLMGLTETPVTPVLRLSRMAEAVLAFMRLRVPKTPCVILIDDAHWLDQDSRALIPRLIDALADRNVLVLAPRRPDGERLVAGAVEIELTAFGRGDSAALISAMDPRETISPTDRQTLIMRAAGVPLYLEHMTRAVLERGGGRQAGTVPNTIVEALIERAESGGEARDLVEAIAILGTDVRTDVLAQMLAREAEDVRQRIAELITRGLLTLSGDGRIEFDHALVRDAVLNTILSARRRRLHDAAIEAYEIVAPGELTKRPDAAAHHLYGAGRATEALPVMIEAAKAGMGAGELREAAGILRRARSALTEIEDPDLRERLEMPVQYMTGAALVQISGFSDPAVGEAYERALALCTKLGGSGEPEFQIAWGIWAHCVVTGQLDQAETSIRRMAEIAREQPDLQVLALAAQSLQAGISGDFAAQRAFLERTRAAYSFERHRMLAVTYTMDPLAMALLFETHSRWIAGDVSGWESAVNETRRHEARLGLGFLGPYIAVYGNAPQTYAPGDPAEVRRIERAIETAAELGQPFWVAAAQVWLGNDRAWRLPAEEALAVQRPAVELQIGIGQTLGLGYHQARMAERYAAAGDHEAAERWLSAAEAELAKGRVRHYRAEIMRLRAAALARRGAQAEDCLAILDEADAQAEDDGHLAWRWMIAATRAEILDRQKPGCGARMLVSALAALDAPGAARHPARIYAAGRLAKLQDA